MRNISLNNTWQLAYFLPKNCYIIMHWAKNQCQWLRVNFYINAVLLCVGVQVLKFWLGRFHQNLRPYVHCSCYLWWMLPVATLGTPPPRRCQRRRQRRRRPNHLAWLFVDASLDTSNGIPAMRAHQNAALLCCYVVHSVVYYATGC